MCFFTGQNRSTDPPIPVPQTSMGRKAAMGHMGLWGSVAEQAEHLIQTKEQRLSNAPNNGKALNVTHAKHSMWMKCESTCRLII